MTAIEHVREQFGYKFVIHVFSFPVAPKVNRDFFPKDITVKKGEEFQIAITYTGNPIPTTKWEQVSLVIVYLCRIIVIKIVVI